MKTVGWLIIFASIFNSSSARPVSRQSIEDSVIGWMKVYHFKGVKETKNVDNKLYSAAQLSVCDSFANWMQASYLPKGGLGDVKKAVSEKLGLYNQYTAARPQCYGTYSKTYFELKYNSSHKLEPETNSNIYWGVFANQVPGDWPIKDICTATQYYFTMPTSETEVDDEINKKILDLTHNENIKPYITYWVKNMGFGGGAENVLLCKDNKSPFIKITKGEYLHALEEAIPRLHEAEKKKIYEQNQGNQKSIDYLMKYLDEKNDKRIACLKNNKEKYKNRLLETAEVFEPQPNIMLEQTPDVFEGNEYQAKKFPVYKIDPAMAELCKKDKPQWILISWAYYPGNPIEEQQHEAIINNFNFSYVYNFFFDSEKVKGQPYKPLHSPYTKEKEVVAAVSLASKKNTNDKNIYFFEDFSSTGIGKKPIGWRTEYGLNGGVVEHPDGLDGNWVLITDNTLTPKQLKNPLPQNFTLSFELVAAQNFAWGAKGLTFQLSKETSPGNAESFLKLKLRPGCDGKDGEATLETKFPSPPGYSNATKWLVASGFSNDKRNNHITVTIIKNKETLQVYINKSKITEYEKAIPAAHLFNAMSFSSGNSGENDKFYISNIKITKD
jgi:hypothetical protein